LATKKGAVKKVTPMGTKRRADSDAPSLFRINVEEDVHGVAERAISVRPWGERSFYAKDKWQNPLCFVEAGTTYPG
jgi:hypothetical protein